MNPKLHGKMRVSFHKINTMSELSHIPSEFRKEFSIDSKGKVTASRRAIARLAGVEPRAVRDLLDKISLPKVLSTGEIDLPDSIQSLAGKDFGDGELPEIVVTSIIEYYALDAGRHCKEQAKLVYRTFSAIGFRAWVQQELGWSATNKGQSYGTPSRLLGKGSRRKLTDAIQDYIDRHKEELSENAIRWLYPNVTNGLYLGTHKLKASQLIQIYNCKKAELRDYFSPDEIEAIMAIEFIAMRLIDVDDIKPIEAMRLAVEQARATNLFVPMYMEEALKLKRLKAGEC